MKKNLLLILLYFGIAVSNNSNAYFYADTNSNVPVAYYVEDSLSKRIGHENPISTIAAISAIAIPITVNIGRKLGFSTGPLALILLLLSSISGVIGLTVRKKLMIGKYARYPEPKKLPLGQVRSWIGIVVLAIALVLGIVFIAIYII